MAAVSHVGFQKNLQFLSCSPCRPAVLLPRTKFRWNRTSVDELWPKTRISRWRPLPSWILINSIFGYVTVLGFNICCSVPNYTKIGRFFTEIWLFNDFQNCGRSPYWIVKIRSFCHVAFAACCSASWCKFHWNSTIGWWVMVKKAIFKMAAIAILI